MVRSKVCVVPIGNIFYLGGEFREVSTDDSSRLEKTTGRSRKTDRGRVGSSEGTRTGEGLIRRAYRNRSRSVSGS